MTVELYPVNNAIALRDADYPHRWYDAFGEGVVKYLQDFATLASDDTTGDATEWEGTYIDAADVHVITDRAGGALLFTTGAHDNDGFTMQLGAVAGENILLNGRYPLYFGTRLAVDEVIQCDLFVGVAVTDVALAAAVTDGIYFRKVDGGTVLQFVVENTNVEDIAGTIDLVAGAYMELEFLFDGEDVIGYFNGQELGRVNKSSAAFPDDQEMRLSFEFLAGEAAVKTCTMEYLRMIHIR